MLCSALPSLPRSMVMCRDTLDHHTSAWTMVSSLWSLLESAVIITSISDHQTLFIAENVIMRSNSRD